MGTIVIQADEDGKDWSKVKTDDVDILYVLEGVGWSRCYLFLQGNIHYMGPTHIFGSPLDDMLNGFAKFLDGENEVNFTWFDEPGTYDWFIKRDDKQHHIINVEIIEYEDVELDLHKEPAKSEIYKRTKFEVKTRHFCTCILKQIEKIEALMHERSYRERREGDFDPVSFKRFRNAYKNKFSVGE